jgi:hypothetical protein
MKMFLLLLGIVSLRLAAQETVFNVPSGDILDRGKLYAEFDFGYRGIDSLKTSTPRVVVGIGDKIEIGLNVNNIVSPGPSQATFTPTIKWRAYDGGDRGWSFLVGDNIFIPAQNKTYNAGTWIYAEFVKTLGTKTRLTFGGYYFSREVVASAQRGGGQFAIEQPVGMHLTLAADWFTGKQSAGYVTPGAILKLNSKLTWYISYEIGNAGAASGNRQLLTEIGWSMN